MQKEHALFQVGLKLLLRRGDEVLFLTDAVGGHFDFPGGRIDADEMYIELSEVIKREVKEEIGNVEFVLRGPVAQVKRHFESKNLHIMVTYYEAEYVSGEIKLSPEHSEYKWINLKTNKPRQEQFHNKEEYLMLKEYLAF